MQNSFSFNQEVKQKKSEAIEKKNWDEIFKEIEIKYRSLYHPNLVNCAGLSLEK
jgi:hypothetical protein